MNWSAIFRSHIGIWPYSSPLGQDYRMMAKLSVQLPFPAILPPFNLSRNLHIVARQNLNPIKARSATATSQKAIFRAQRKARVKRSMAEDNNTGGAAASAGAPPIESWVPAAGDKFLCCDAVRGGGDTHLQCPRHSTEEHARATLTGGWMLPACRRCCLMPPQARVEWALKVIDEHKAVLGGNDQPSSTQPTTSQAADVTASVEPPPAAAAAEPAAKQEEDEWSFDHIFPGLTARAAVTLGVDEVIRSKSAVEGFTQDQWAAIFGDSGPKTSIPKGVPACPQLYAKLSASWETPDNLRAKC